MVTWIRRGACGRVGLWTALATLALALAPPNALARGQRATASAPLAGTSTTTTEEDHVSGVGSEELHGHSRVKERSRRPVHGRRRLVSRRARVQHVSPPPVAPVPPRAAEPRFVVPRWDDDPPSFR